MRIGDAVGIDATYKVTVEQFQVVQEAVIGIIREKVIGRNTVPVTNLNDFGATQWK